MKGFLVVTHTERLSTVSGLAKGSAMLTKPATQNTSKGGSGKMERTYVGWTTACWDRAWPPVCGKLPGLQSHWGWIEDNRRNGRGREREREVRTKNLTKLDVFMVYIFSSHILAMVRMAFFFSTF